MMKNLLYLLPFLAFTVYAGSNFNRVDDPVVNQNFMETKRLADDVVLLTSTQTIRGYKHFTNNADFTTISVTGVAPAIPQQNVFYEDTFIKGWVSFDGTSPTAIRDSVNVTSTTYKGVGNYNITWATDFANSSYACVGSAGTNVNRIVTFRNYATGNVDVRVNDDAGSSADEIHISVICIGNQ